jgi:hypothetical protein
MDDIGRNEFRRDYVSMGLFLVLGFLLACTPLRTFDIWWSLKTGQQILERGVVPRTDWFTYTEPDGVWINLHWGFQLLVTFMDRFWGVPGLVVSKASCLMLVAGLSWASFQKRLPTWALVLCWLGPVIIVSGRIMVRAEMISFVCLAAWMWALSRSEERPAVIWTFPLIQVVWTNCHGLFAVGWAVGTMWLCDNLMRHLTRGKWGVGAVPQVSAGAAILGWLGFSLASFLNPYGLEGVKMPYMLWHKLSTEYEFYSTRNLDLISMPALIRQLIQAGRPFADVYLNITILMTGTAVLGLLWLLIRHRRLSVLRTLLLIAFVILAVKSVRSMSLLGIVSGFIVASNFRERWALSKPEHVASISQPGPSAAIPESSISRFFARSVLLAGIALMSTGWWPAFTRAPQFRLSLSELPNHFAHDAAKFAGRTGLPQRCFTAGFGTAGLYTYHNCPPCRIFLDGRLESSSKELFQRYESIRFKMRDGNSLWIEELRDENGELPVVLLDRTSAPRAIQNVARTPGWSTVYSDHLAVVFVENAVAERLSLPVVSAAKPSALPVRE